MDELIRLIERVWPYVITSVPGAWALWKVWVGGQALVRADRTDLIKIAQEAAGAVIEDLREETDRLRARLEEVERELSDLQKRHTDMIADKDAKITMLEGENRQLLAQIDAYRDILARHGIPEPVQGQAYYVVTREGQLEPAASAPTP